MLKIFRISIISLLSFMFVYAFPIYRPLKSDIISAVFIFLLVIFNKNSLNQFIRLIRSKGFSYLLLIYIIFILLVIMFTIFHGAFDFSMIKTLLNNIFSLFVCAALVSVVYTKFKKLEISSLIVILLILQSLFIIVMFFLPDIRQEIQNFLLTPFQLEKMASYGGVRGVSLSGSVAFGIAVLMGAMGFILHYWFVTIGKEYSSLFKSFIFIIALIASLSAGRSSILGFILGFYLYIFYYSFFSSLKAYVKYLLIGIIFLVLLYYFVTSYFPYADYIIDKYTKYAFRPILNYFSEGSFSVNSLNKLEHMYFYPPSGNILFGDGYYIDINGGYYMKTDAGYMRFLLFFGIVGSAIIYLLFIGYAYYMSRKNLNPKFKFFILGFVVMFFIYHYKGDVILWSVGLMKIFTLMIFSEYIKYLNNKERKGENKNEYFIYN